MEFILKFFHSNRSSINVLKFDSDFKSDFTSVYLFHV